jgi:hypothetical protein
MGAAIVFFQNVAGNDLAQLIQTFAVSGVNTDPTLVSCVITDPTGTAVTHTFAGAAPADITKTAVGIYQLNVGCTLVGMWSYVWIGTGNASDVQAGTFTVQPTSNLHTFYTSVEELKSRLKITDTGDDFELQLAVQSAARAVEGYCGRFFYQVSDTRTFVPYNIYEQPLADLVSVSALNVDMDGDGIFEQPWTQGVDYQLAVGEWDFNTLATGEARPYTWARVINSVGGGRFFPFIWPFAPLNRIQVIGVFGWPSVPLAIKQATLQVASEIFKLKDAPFGLMGSSEFGVVRLPKQNPYVMKLLQPYINGRRRVGI